MTAVYRAAFNVARAQPFRIFLVNFSQAEQAHTIGIHLGEGGALHFFDPNCGEFDFPDDSAADLKSFFDEWWQAFYMIPRHGRLVQHWEHWGLEGVRRRG